MSSNDSGPEQSVTSDDQEVETVTGETVDPVPDRYESPDTGGATEQPNPASDDTPSDDDPEVTNTDDQSSDSVFEFPEPNDPAPEPTPTATDQSVTSDDQEVETVTGETVDPVPDRYEIDDTTQDPTPESDRADTLTDDSPSGSGGQNVDTGLLGGTQQGAAEAAGSVDNVSDQDASESNSSDPSPEETVTSDDQEVETVTGETVDPVPDRYEPPEADGTPQDTATDSKNGGTDTTTDESRSGSGGQNIGTGLLDEAQQGAAEAAPATDPDTAGDQDTTQEGSTDAGDVQGGYTGPETEPLDLTRREFRAVARVANQNENISATDLTVEDSRVVFTDEARREQFAQAVERQLETTRAERTADQAAASGATEEQAQAVEDSISYSTDSRPTLELDLGAEDATIADVTTDIGVTGAASAALGDSDPTSEILLGSQPESIVRLDESGRKAVREAQRERVATILDVQTPTETTADDLVRTEQGSFQLNQQAQEEIEQLQNRRQDAGEALGQYRSTEQVEQQEAQDEATLQARRRQFRNVEAQVAAEQKLREEAAQSYSDQLGFDISPTAINITEEQQDGKTVLMPSLDAEAARQAGRRQTDALSVLVGATDYLVEKWTPIDEVQDTGSAANVRRVNQLTGETDVTDTLTRGGILSEDPDSNEGLLPGTAFGVNLSESGFRNFANDIRDISDTFDENPAVQAPFVGTAPERILQGVANFGVETAAAVAQSPALVDTGIEIGQNLPGTVQQEGVGETVSTGVGVGSMIAAQSVRELQARPLERGAGTLAGIVTGAGLSRAIDEGATSIRNRRVAARADSKSDLRDITTEAGVRGESPEFETDTSAPTQEAVEELDERAAENPDAIGPGEQDSSVFHTTGADISGARGLRNRVANTLNLDDSPDIQIAEGASELPGLFISPDASPLGLALDSDSSFSMSSLLSPRLPGRTESDQVVSLPGDDIRAMPESARGAGYELRDTDGDPVERGLSRGKAKEKAEGTDLQVRPQSDLPAYEFLSEQAEEGAVFVRPTATRTSELEGIVPPGSEFVEEGITAVRMPSGRLIPARRFVRPGESSVDVDQADATTPSSLGDRNLSLPSRQALTPDDVAETLTPTGVQRSGITVERDADAGLVEIDDEVLGALRAPLTELESRAYGLGARTDRALTDARRQVQGAQVRAETAAFQAGRAVRNAPERVEAGLRRLQRRARIRGRQVGRAALDAPNRAIREGEALAFRAGIEADRALTDLERGILNAQTRAETAAFRLGQQARERVDTARSLPSDARNRAEDIAGSARRASQVPLERAEARAYDLGVQTDRTLQGIRRELLNAQVQAETAAFRGGEVANEGIDIARQLPESLERQFSLAVRSGSIRGRQAAGTLRNVPERVFQEGEAFGYRAGVATDRAITDFQRGVFGAQARAQTTAFGLGQETRQLLGGLQTAPGNVSGTAEGLGSRARRLSQLPLERAETEAFGLGVDTGRALTDARRSVFGVQARAESAAFELGQQTDEAITTLQATPERVAERATDVSDRARRLSELPLERAGAEAYNLGVAFDRTLYDSQRGIFEAQARAETTAFRFGEETAQALETARELPDRVVERGVRAAEVPFERAEARAFGLGVEGDRVLTDLERGMLDAQVRAETAAFRIGEETADAFDRATAIPDDARTFADEITVRVGRPNDDRGDSVEIDRDLEAGDADGSLVASELPETRVTRQSPDEAAGPGGAVGGTTTVFNSDEPSLSFVDGDPINNLESELSDTERGSSTSQFESRSETLGSDFGSLTSEFDGWVSDSSVSFSEGMSDLTASSGLGTSSGGPTSGGSPSSGSPSGGYPSSGSPSPSSPSPGSPSPGRPSPGTPGGTPGGGTPGGGPPGGGPPGGGPPGIPSYPPQRRVPTPEFEGGQREVDDEAEFEVLQVADMLDSRIMSGAEVLAGEGGETLDQQIESGAMGIDDSEVFGSGGQDNDFGFGGGGGLL